MGTRGRVLVAPRPSVLEILESLPPRPLLCETAEEVDRYIQEERDSWDR